MKSMLHPGDQRSGTGSSLYTLFRWDSSSVMTSLLRLYSQVNLKYLVSRHAISVAKTRPVKPPSSQEKNKNNNNKKTKTKKQQQKTKQTKKTTTTTTTTKKKKKKHQKKKKKKKSTVEPQWLENLWDHGNSFDTWVVRATED